MELPVCVSDCEFGGSEIGAKGGWDWEWSFRLTNSTHSQKSH